MGRSLRALEILLAFGLAIMTGLVFANVVLRYAMNSGIVTSEEISRYIFVWLTFIGAVVVTIEGGHQRMDFLLERLPLRLAHLFTILGYLLMLLCAALLGYGSWRLALSNMENTSPVAGMPVGLLYWAGAVASIGIGFALLLQIWNAMRNKKR